MASTQANRAPRHLTVLVALVVAAVGALGAFGPLPDELGWLFVVSTVVMLLGIFLPGL
jgi:hypothetical protein